MPTYAPNGSIYVTVVDGTSRTGLIAADGSRYIVMSDGSAPVGVHHPCGAWNATYAPENGPCPSRAPDGSFYVSDTRRDGALYVTVVSGSLGSRAVDAPIISAVSITGTFEVEETLTATKTSSGTATTTYIWYRDGVPISGETSSTYDAVEDDLDTDISVQISMVNASGSDSMTSIRYTIAASSEPENALQLNGATLQLDSQDLTLGL
jgi:hypothetical protein